MELLGVGVPVITGPAQGWNFWPVLGIPFALVVALRWLRLPRTAWVIVLAILAGLLVGDAVAWWGVVPAGAVAVMLTGLAAVALHGIRREPPSDV